MINNERLDYFLLNDMRTTFLVYENNKINNLLIKLTYIQKLNVNLHPRFKTRQN